MVKFSTLADRRMIAAVRSRQDLPAGGPEKSGAPGGKSATRRLRLFLILLGPVLVLSGAFYYDFEVRSNFDVVVPGKLYRAGQPGEEQLEDWIREFELRSILDFRHSVPEYERELARKHGVRLFHLPFSARTGLSEEHWREIREILTREENLPLLYHCQSGADRTGLVTARYRVEVQGRPLEEALREMIFHYHLPLQYPLLQEQLRELYGDEELAEKATGSAR
jgi:protein tyrosine/serine phosphatase